MRGNGDGVATQGEADAMTAPTEWDIEADAQRVARRAARQAETDSYLDEFATAKQGETRIAGKNKYAIVYVTVQEIGRRAHFGKGKRQNNWQGWAIMGRDRFILVNPSAFPHPMKCKTLEAAFISPLPSGHFMRDSSFVNDGSRQPLFIKYDDNGILVKVTGIGQNTGSGGNRTDIILDFKDGRQKDFVKFREATQYTGATLAE